MTAHGPLIARLTAALVAGLTAGATAADYPPPPGPYISEPPAVSGLSAPLQAGRAVPPAPLQWVDEPGTGYDATTLFGAPPQARGDTLTDPPPSAADWPSTAVPNPTPQSAPGGPGYQPAHAAPSPSERPLDHRMAPGERPTAPAATEGMRRHAGSTATAGSTPMPSAAPVFRPPE